MKTFRLISLQRSGSSVLRISPGMMGFKDLTILPNMIMLMSKMCAYQLEQLDILQTFSHPMSL